MKSSRAVVCRKSREIDLGIVFHNVAASGELRARWRWRTAAIAFTLPSLLLFYGALPGWAQSENSAAEIKRPALQIGSLARPERDRRLPARFVSGR